MAGPRNPTRPGRQVLHTDVEAVASRLVGIDLSGGRATVENAPGFTIGDASKANAMINATGLDTGSASAPTLLEAWAKWRAQQNAATAAIKVASPDRTAADVEHKAMRKSARHLGKRLREGMSPAAACASAHAKYRKHGGHSTFSTWAKKIAAG